MPHEKQQHTDSLQQPLVRWQVDQESTVLVM